MKKLKLLGMATQLVGALILVSCATSPQSDEVPPDISEAAQDEGAPPPTSQAATGDTSEAELSPEGKPAVQAPEGPPPSEQPLVAENQPPPPEAQPQASDLDAPPQAPAAAEPPPPAPENNSQAAPPPPAPMDTGGAPARVVALDYRANVNGGTMVVKTDHPVAYTTRKNNQTNQFVVELKNTNIPTRFQRPYDTKEFSGPIASINGYQAGDSARLVVQLREPVTPSIFQNGNAISVAGQGGLAQPSQEVADNSQGGGEEAESSPPSGGSSGSNEKDDAALQTSSVDDLTFGNSNKFYGRPISLELKDADVRDVFAFISEESGLNIVVGDDVTGKVTLKLRKIPWDQALQVLLQAKQLGYVRQGNILRISTLQAIQKESDQQRSALEAKRLLEPLHVQVFPISYANVTDIDMQAKDFLSPRGKSRADKRTNNLVVTDIDENLVKIKALVKRLDTQTPEVMIEAKIVEARESYSKFVGVNWSFNGAQVDTGMTNNQGSPVFFQPNASTPASASGNFFQAGFSLGQMDVFGNLSATLSLAETEGLIKILSAPRVVTIDRQEADIKQSQKIPYLTSGQPPPTAGATGTTSTFVPFTVPQIQFIEVKLELTVKPQITVDGSIIMDLHLLREFADPVINFGNGSTAPPVESREAKTQVLVENGDTIVIGGIYQAQSADTTTGVPWLSKVPLLGWLFKNDLTSREKNELVMFLTPRILNREKAFGTATDQRLNVPAPRGPSPVGQRSSNSPGKG